MPLIKRLKQFWFIFVPLAVVTAILGSIFSDPYSRYMLPKTRAVPKQEGLFLYHWGFLKRITPPNTYPLDISWSPDGDRIALGYTHDFARLDPNQYIGILDVKTYQLTPLLTIEKADIHNGLPTEIDRSQKINIAWSPDGNKILFNQLSPENNQQLYLLDVQTKVVTPTHLVFKETHDKRNYDLGIAWAPGPLPVLRVCFDIAEIEEECGMYATNDEFTKLTLLTDNYFWDDFKWLADAKTLVFSCYYGDKEAKTPQTGLCSYSLDERQVKLITKKLVSADWSPDGLFAFGIGGGGGEGERSYYVVYNKTLDRVDRLPSWLTLGFGVGNFSP